MRKFLLLLISILVIPAAFSLITFSPSSLNLCGSYSQFATITANITNQNNFTLQNIAAAFYITGNPGLSFMTPQSLNLGSLNSSRSVLATYTIQCSSPNQNVYTGYFNLTATGYKESSKPDVLAITVHSSSSFTGNMTISQTPVTEQSPAFIGDNTPALNVNTNRNAVCRGSLDLDESYSSMDFIFYGSARSHEYTFLDVISNGIHKVYVKCQDEYGFIMSDSMIISFIIDTSSPQIVLENPKSAVIGNYVDFKVSMNEEGECRYGKSDEPYDSLSKFDLKTGSLFTKKLSDLDEKAYDYYVKCKDKVGNIAALKASFEVQLPPEVEIRYERLPPLPKGTFEIRLEPSKELRELPKLYYRYTDDDEFRRDVSLVKDDEEYIGYVIIEDQVIPRSGQFFFEGYDLQGNKGTQITEGGAFLVDTIRPPSPTDVAIKAENEGVRLVWYYDGEEPDHFNVYRSTANGVGHIHYYDSVTRQEFLDDNVLNSQIYYYRVAAVDDAGNVGSFSPEVNVYAKGKNTVSSDVKEDTPSNPPTKETKEWKDRTQKDVESLLIDLDYAVSNLREQGAKEAAVEELGLIKKATDAKSEAEKLKVQLSGLDLIRVSDAELKDILSKGDALVARTKKLVPQSIELLKSTNSVQATSLSDIQSAIKEFMAKRTDNLSDSDQNFYQKEIEKINEKIRVELAIKTLEVGFIDGSKENRVLVRKEFSYDSSDPLLSAIAIEIIPKTLAADISSVDIRTPDYYVVNEDPVVSFSYGSLGYEKQSITYVVMANDDSEGAKNTKLIILKEPEKRKNMLTGFSILNVGGGFQILGLIFGVIIIVGLGLYYLTIVGTLELPKLGSQSKESQYLGHSPVMARPQEYFHLRNGDVIRGISELRTVLIGLDDITFNYHVHSGVNDFSDWIIKTYNDQELAAKVRKEKTRKKTITLLERVRL